MTDPETAAATGQPSTVARNFLVLTVSASLVAFDLGFELGAFDTVSYRRLFAVFVVSTVVLAATVVADDDSFATSATSRVILGLPLLYLLADITFLTASQTVVDLLSLAVLLTFPYTLYVVASLLGGDFFLLPRREQIVATAVVVGLGLAGLYVGDGHARFLRCDDFERIGDFVPADCTP